MMGHRKSILCALRAGALLAASALVAARAPAVAQEGGLPSEAAAVVPAEAAAVACFDFRASEPTVQLLLEQLKPQERAVGGAVLALLGQFSLTALAAELDFDTDVLPWLGRRAYLAALPGPEGGTPRLLALLEVTDPATTDRTLDRVLPRVAQKAKGKYFQRAVDGALLRHLAIPGFGHLQMLRHGPVLGFSRSIGLLEAWAQRPPAPAGEPEWARAMRLVPPGPFVLAVTPRVAPGMAADPLAATGVVSAALSVSASAAGSRADLALRVADGPAGTLVQQFRTSRLTEEALGAIPETALAALSVAPLTGEAAALGTGLMGAVLEELADGQADLGEHLRGVLGNLLAQETAVALLAAAPAPRVLVAVTQPGEEAARATVAALRSAVTGTRGLQVTDAPSGFRIAFPERPGTLLHGACAASAGRWLLLASDAEALQAGLATAAAPRPAGLGSSASYWAAAQETGGNAALAFFADTRGLGRALAVMGHKALARSEVAPIPEKYLVRLFDALLLPLGAMRLTASAGESAVRLTLFQQVDWQAGSSMITGAPAVAGMVAAVAIPAFARAQDASREAAARQTLRSIHAAQRFYREETKRYGNLDQLRAKGLVSFGEKGTDAASGYRFTTKVVKPGAYVIVAEPPKPGMTTYTVNEQGVIAP